MRLGIIGYGNIARTLMRLLAEAVEAPLEAVSVLTPPAKLAETQAAFDVDQLGVSRDGTVHTTLAAFLDRRPDLVVECAGHAAIADFVPDVLRQGIDTIIVSIGALADAALEAELREAACVGGAQIILPAGAVGGIDILSALRPAGITSVVYTGRKPPKAWMGTPAEASVELDQITEAVTFFAGNARDAARQFPKNANVAATLALSGLGFEQTQVRLIADPQASGNSHEYSVDSAVARFSIQIENKASAANPKTSVTTAYSVLRAVMNRHAALAI